MQPSTISNNNHLFTEILIPEKKIQQLQDAEYVGKIKTQQKLSIRNNVEKYVTQKYFSGLVYRYDSRDLQQIKASNGFYPRVRRKLDDPVLFKDVWQFTGLYDLIIITSRDVEGVIATSKHITDFNIGMTSPTDYKYMIDTQVNSNYGLDPDAIANLNRENSKYEVIFEDPLSINSIVGYFKNKDTTKFYVNDEYTGNFSWDAENVVENYNQQIETAKYKAQSRAKCVIL
jgi:CRISPR/Cas system-associated endoribonuclease Cas2